MRIAFAAERVVIASRVSMPYEQSVLRSVVLWTVQVVGQLRHIIIWPVFSTGRGFLNADLEDVAQMAGELMLIPPCFTAPRRMGSHGFTSRQSAELCDVSVMG